MTRLDYHRAASVEEAVELLERYGEDAQILAGGTSVMLLRRLGLLAADHLIGIHALDALGGIRTAATGSVWIGALATLDQLERSALVGTVVPALAEAAHQVATVRIRNQATIGGNLAHADPAQDVPPMLIALDAAVETASSAGVRRIPVEELFTGYLQTSLDVGELITGVVVPAPAAGTRAGYLKFLPGTQDDYATVSVAVAAQVVDGAVHQPRVVLGAAGATPRRAHQVEAALAGRPAGSTQLSEAASLVGEDIEPMTDARGTAGYKRAMAQVCVGRLLRRLLVEEEHR